MNNLYTIFVNYNSKEQLYKGVKKVLTLPSVNGVIIVDNGSKDNSLNLIKKIKGKNIIIIENSDNVGFYKAVNMGIRKALELNANLVMPLDFDLDFSLDFISKLLKVKADIVAPVLKFKRDDKWIFDYGGKINWIIGRSTHLEKANPIYYTGSPRPAGDKSNQNSYDFISGGCTIFKKDVIEKIGYFDEKYFVYYGDTDYSLRASKAGFKVIMDKNTIVHHKLEITKETKNISKLKIALGDNLIFINKWIKWYFKPFAYFYLGLLYMKTILNLIYRI